MLERPAETGEKSNAASVRWSRKIFSAVATNVRAAGSSAAAGIVQSLMAEAHALASAGASLRLVTVATFLAIFIGVTLLLLVVTLMNRLRVRRVLLSWHRGQLFGLPLWPSLFLVAVLAFCLCSALIRHVVPLELVAGYLLGGLFWFVAGVLSGSILVTEYGLVFHAKQAEQAVAWGQVVDYFKASGTRPRYVFFYRDPSGTRQRLELKVPRAREAVFGRIVEGKLDARFEPQTQQMVVGK